MVTERRAPVCVSECVCDSVWEEEEEEEEEGG